MQSNLVRRLLSSMVRSDGANRMECNQYVGNKRFMRCKIVKQCCFSSWHQQRRIRNRFAILYRISDVVFFIVFELSIDRKLFALWPEWLNEFSALMRCDHANRPEICHLWQLNKSPEMSASVGVSVIRPLQRPRSTEEKTHSFRLCLPTTTGEPNRRR